MIIIVGAMGSGTRWFYSSIKNLLLNKEEVKYFNEETDDKFPSAHNTFKVESELNNKIIHIIRNPIDSIYSRIRDNNIKEDVYEEYAKTWNLLINQGIKGRKNDNYLEIRYEDILINPNKFLDELEKFLNYNIVRELFLNTINYKPLWRGHNELNNEIKEKILNITLNTLIIVGYDKNGKLKDATTNSSN